MAESNQLAVTERELRGWKLMSDFRERLERVGGGRLTHPTWSDEQRRLKAADYLSLFLFGLVNPVVETMRGLCQCSHLQRVEEEICRRRVSLGSFSEAQHVLDPALLEEVFRELSQQWSAQNNQSQRRWLIQDGSLFEALPRMHWALWRRQGTQQNAVRLHLTFDLGAGAPARALITEGKSCERAAWRKQSRRGDCYVADRYYGENYGLFGELDQGGITFVVRLRDNAVITVKEELPLTASDRQANVIRSASVILGGQKRYHSVSLRVIWVQSEKEVLRLVTNLGADELSAGEVALLYKQRWQIELFFRWIKCILGCRHWLAHSNKGAAIQIYLALIAALLLQLYIGQRPNRRMMELLQFYFSGIATLGELERGLEQQIHRQSARKKS